MAAATSIIPTMPKSTTVADLPRHRRLARARDRRACRRHQMAVHRPAVRRRPAARSARPAGADAADAQPRHPQRGRALGRPRGQQPVRAQPLPRLRPVGGRVARHLRRRLVARAHRTCRSTAPSAKAIGSTNARAFSPKEPGLPAAFRTSSDEPASATAGSSTSPTATASTRTISPSAATRST